MRSQLKWWTAGSIHLSAVGSTAQAGRLRHAGIGARIIFRYRGWQDYRLLFAIGATALLAVAYADIRRGAISKHRQETLTPASAALGEKAGSVRIG
jgi:hypothetical protein